MPATHFLANDIIEYIKTEYPTCYLAIFTVAPTKSGGGTEVTGGSYARPAVVMADVFDDAAASSTSDSDLAVDFVTPTADWGTPKAIALMDDDTGGNMLFYYPLPLALQIPIGIGSAQSFPIGNLIIRNV